MNAEEMRKEADSIRPSDPARAAELYAEASDMGDAQASSSLGYMLMVGEGVGKDLKKAVEYLRKAADAGDAKAMVNLGNLILEEDPTEALRCFETAGEAGSVTAMMNAAVMHRTGAGIPMDASKAVYWLEKASESDVSAMSVLAHILRTGENVPADKPRAAGLYRRAAELGDADSQYDLAMMLDSGDGIPMDREEAEKWFRESASQGDNDARLCLGGILYERGDYAGAEEVFTDAAIDGDPKAMYNLALIYAGGNLGTPDMGKAKEWLEGASDMGFAYAQSMLGTILLDEGRKNDAIDLLRKAAEQNEPVAMYNLGALALSGQVEMNDREAVGYLVRAAESGVPEAAELLGRLSGQGLIRSRPVQKLFQRFYLEGARDPFDAVHVAVHYGAVYPERLRGQRIVLAVADVQRPLLRDVEMGEGQGYGVGGGLVQLRLIPTDDDLRDPVETAVGHQVLDLVPPLAGRDPDVLPVGFESPENPGGLRERLRPLVRVGFHDLVEPVDEVLMDGRVLGHAGEDVVHRHPQVLPEMRRVVIHAEGREGLLQDRLDPGPGVEQGVVEVEQVEVVFLHLVPT